MLFKLVLFMIRRLVLASASPLIKRLLDTVTEPLVTIQLPDVKVSHMRNMLDFLYTGQTCVQVCILGVLWLHNLEVVY